MVLINVVTPFEIRAYVLSAVNIIFIEETNVMKGREHIFHKAAMHASGITTAIEVLGAHFPAAAMVASDVTTAFEVRSHILRAG